MHELNSIVPEDAKYGVQTSAANVDEMMKQEAIKSTTSQVKKDEVPEPDIESNPQCTGCKSSSPAVANCFSCTAMLCAICVIAHQLMVAFEGHHVTNLGQGSFVNKDVDHTTANVNIEALRRMIKEAKKKLDELQKTIKSVDYSSSRLTTQYDKAVSEVNETFNFYVSMLAERKLEVVKELEKLYSTKQVALSVFGQKIHESTDNIDQMINFIERLLQSASTKDVLLFQSSLETRMSHLLSTLPQLDLANTVQLEVISNFQAIQVGVRNQFGYVKSGSDAGASLNKPLPISRPANVVDTANSLQLTNSVMSGLKATTLTTTAEAASFSSDFSAPKDLANSFAGLD